MNPEYADINLFELERMMMPWENLKDAPLNIQEIAKDSASDGTPTGFGNHPKYGWYVISAGQGPMIVHVDKNIDDIETLYHD